MPGTRAVGYWYQGSTGTEVMMMTMMMMMMMMMVCAADGLAERPSALLWADSRRA